MLRSIAARAARTGSFPSLAHRPCAPALLPGFRPPSHFRPYVTPPGEPTVNAEAPPLQWPRPRPKDGIGRERLILEMPSGAETKFSWVWLRDHCREDRSVHPKTKQRLVDAFKIPPDIRPEKVRDEEEGLYITWPAYGNETSYESFYPWSFLVKYAYDPPMTRKSDFKSERPRHRTWTKTIGAKPPTVTYEEVMESEEGVYEWLKRIDIFGFSFVTGVPATPDATEALIRRIAFIRETHYGGFWDFTANLEHGDLAYSDVRLEAHTDTTYFTDACGLQLFHLLSPADTHTGGHNLLVDGFRAASALKNRSPKCYKLLSEVCVGAHASGSGSASHPSGVHMRPLRSYPVFNHDERGDLVQVRWNGDDRAPIGGGGFSRTKVDQWYKAVRAWENVLRSDEAQLWTKMEPGTAIIFDNHRVLHGRSAFTGTRRLCGAYISGDDYRSRLRGLEKQFGKAEGNFPAAYWVGRKGVEGAMDRLGIKRGKKVEGKEAWEDFL